MGLNNPTSNTVPQEGEDDTVVVKMDCDAPIKAMATGLRCVVGQDCVQRDMVVNAEIVHVASAAPTKIRWMDQSHKGFVDDNADDTAATVAELGDANGTTVPEGWNKFSIRSNSSQKRYKPRRSNIESSATVWSKLC